MNERNVMMKTTKNRIPFFLIAALLFSALYGVQDVCGQVSGLFTSVKKVEADPKKEYPLTDSDGLWFIMAAKFTGTESKKNANRLVYELRSRYKLPAYTFKYDNSDDDLEKMARKSGDTRSYQYMSAPPQVYAVLIGSFPAADDPALQKILIKIKRRKPKTLENDPESKRTLKEFEILAKSDKEYAEYGPLGKAMAVPNPMIPKEYFAQKGVVDSFLAKINSDSKYSLLKNPRMYTLRVATFGGKSMMNKDSGGQSKWDKAGSEFEDAGVKAAALCAALRKSGVEAWEFHDRDCSFVTIGCFDSYGVPNSDGTIEMDPEIYKLMEKYKGEIIDEKGNYKAYCANVEIGGKGKKKIKMELAFDMQPVIIMVPQLPANAKKVQAAMAQRRKDDEIRKDAHFAESMEADQMIYEMKYGNRDRGSLSEGTRVTDEEISRMMSGGPAPVAAKPAAKPVSTTAAKPAVTAKKPVKTAMNTITTQPTAQKTVRKTAKVKKAPTY